MSGIVVCKTLDIHNPINIFSPIHVTVSVAKQTMSVSRQKMSTRESRIKLAGVPERCYTEKLRSLGGILTHLVYVYIAQIFSRFYKQQVTLLFC